jgi:lysyl-tRNA synthetase class 2
MCQPPTADCLSAASLANLRLRAALLRRLREFFDARGFLEVETPVLSADTVVDRHLDPFQISGQWSVASGQREERAERRGERGQTSESALTLALSQGERGQNNEPRIPESPNPAPPNPQSLIPNPSPALWLQTSPEFHMKRLLAAGGGRIYQVARVFRQGELGPLHNPEFTLVEWYQPGEGYEDGMQLTVELCETLLSGAECPHPLPLSQSARGEEKLSYREAFQRHVGIDPHTADGAAIQAAAKKLGVAAPESLSPDDRDGWLDLLLSECVQPHLGIDGPTILYDYPASQAALARLRHDPGRPPVAERFELFVAGMELANGYHELLDPAELRSRNERVNAQRVADGKQPLPVESRLLAAMEAGLPAAVGVALGFDRLVMLAAGAKSIAEVMAFPFDRA